MAARCHEQRERLDTRCQEWNGGENLSVDLFGSASRALAVAGCCKFASGKRELGYVNNKSVVGHQYCEEATPARCTVMKDCSLGRSWRRHATRRSTATTSTTQSLPKTSLARNPCESALDVEELAHSRQGHHFRRWSTNTPQVDG